VLHTVGYLKENRGKVTDSARVSNIAKIEAPDDYTVRMTLTNPNPDFLANDIYNIEITAKHVAAAGKQLENTAIGTGPFILKEFETATGFKSARNPNYWARPSTGSGNEGGGSGDALPYLDGIIGHYISDRGTVIAAFTADNLDMLNAEDIVQFGTVQKLKPDLTYERFYGQYGYGFFFALDTPPFSDVRVRRAINLTADRQDMLVKAAFGEGVINPPGVYGWKKGFAAPQEDLVKLPGYNRATKQQDIAEAKRLLAEAGFPNGFSAKLTFGVDSTNPKPMAEVLTSQLQQLGINLTLVPLDRASVAQANRDESFEFHVLGVNGESRSELYERFHTKGVFNKRGPKDPEIDAILEQYVAEFDVAAAQKLAQRFQRRLYDQAYFIGAFERSSYTVYQPWVHDVLNNYGANPIPYWWPPAAWMDVDLMPAARRTEKVS
jgi:peptide/nickel transport system substrate-binding protein